MKIPKIEIRCKECGKLAPIDKEHSNKNWIAYKTNEPCKCGGTFGMWADGKPLTADK